MSPSYDILPFLPLAFMNFCLIDFKFEILELPTFAPNEYLYFTHHDKVNMLPNTHDLESNIPDLKFKKLEKRDESPSIDFYQDTPYKGKTKIHPLPSEPLSTNNFNSPGLASPLEQVSL